MKPETLLTSSLVSFLLASILSRPPYMAALEVGEFLWFVLALSYLAILIFLLQVVGFILLGLGAVNMVADSKKQKPSIAAWVALGGLLLTIALSYPVFWNIPLGYFD